ncbi:MAG: hypothetical protein HY452_00570 [Parcubacteria group bacterium]|nr:hypothetical protein [Parcubacteria group bacterium]
MKNVKEKLFCSCASVMILVLLLVLMEYNLTPQIEYGSILALIISITPYSIVFAVIATAAIYAFLRIIVSTAFAIENVPLLRIFGCLLVGVIGIGFGFYFPPTLVIMASISIASIVLMFASLYLPCPRFLQWTAKPENGAG